jgi:hypothetical protein
VIRWLSGALVVLALTGCASTVSGTARPDPNFEPPPEAKSGAASDVLGDVSTVDPCSLLDDSELAKHGEVERPQPESFDYCRLDVALSAGGNVVIRFGELWTVDASGLVDAKEVESPGEVLRVFEEELGTDACNHTVVFTDDVGLLVSGDTFDSSGPKVADLCAVVADVSGAIVTRLETEDDPVEHVTYGSDSIGGLDACDGVDDATVTAVVGPAAEDKITYPAAHQCRWGEAVPSVSVRYARGEPTETEAEKIADRDTFVFGSDIGDRSLCAAETTIAGSDELAQVIVRLTAGQVDAACQGARTVAAEVWTELPG